MSTTTTEAPKTYRLSSSPFLNAPGLIAWAKNGYKFERDRKNMIDVVCGTWGGLPRDAVEALLTGSIQQDLDGDTVVFTFSPPVGACAKDS
ncbi:hypothetical protein C7441_11046 [Pseudaminobacter salicylatoxidans]|uniref:Uncharacterized protein n=1 Tax=Pseudaminobacter salicylatoxidans TaxID=93369 RepID=A0A316C1V8_PSESE|nr:hypothetical protein [Pseudaminobacter salicylatoxidans]PWJ81514.1 hypothetical protein C7441_11046 [Pseudaminobacter salicylatoxidans]